MQRPDETRQEPIETLRCRLVPLDLDLARAMLGGDFSAVRPAHGWPHEDSLTVVRARLTLGWPTWLVTRLDSGEVIGECGLKGWAGPSGTVEIGYGLAAPVRGQGYGREMVAALVGWVEGRRLADAVLAEVAAGNTPSRRLVEGLGFVEHAARNGFVYYRLPLARR
jgi:RimJ/RimL family protein N-acetyltransferase